LPSPNDRGRGGSALDRDLRLDSRGSSVLVLVLAALLVVGGFGLLFAQGGASEADLETVLLLGGAVLVPVVLGCLVLYFGGGVRSFTRMGPVVGTIVLAVVLTGLVIGSAVVVIFAVCLAGRVVASGAP
jgi:hypothetical protein